MEVGGSSTMEVGESSTMKVGKKGGRGARRDGERKKYVSKSVRAGLQFPVGRIARYLKKGRFAERIGKGAPIFMAAVLEYVAIEVLELAGMHAETAKKKRITPRHILTAVKEDAELSKLFAGVIIPGGGVPYSKKRSEETPAVFVPKTPRQIRNDLVRAPTNYITVDGAYAEPGIPVDSSDDSFGVNTMLGIVEHEAKGE